ncbi:MAG: TolB family protein, partial [Vicinamibacterales bacterium]
IWTVPLDGDRNPVPIVQTPFNERLAQFSPDGRWIAYESNESGRYEIYVQAFGGPNEKIRGSVPVSANGGAQVRWRPDGKALFYLALDDRLMTVPIGPSNGQALELGAPVLLFVARVVGGALQEFPRHQYSVTPDGQRFLMNVERGEAAPSPISVVLNWTGRGR